MPFNDSCWESGVLNFLLSAANCNSHERWGKTQSTLYHDATLTTEETLLVDIAYELGLKPVASATDVARYDAKCDTLHLPEPINEHQLLYGLPLSLSITLAHCSMYRDRALCGSPYKGADEGDERVRYIGLVAGYCLCANMGLEGIDSAFVAYLHETFNDRQLDAQTKEAICRDAKTCTHYLMLMHRRARI